MAVVVREVLRLPEQIQIEGGRKQRLRKKSEVRRRRETGSEVRLLEQPELLLLLHPGDGDEFRVEKKPGEGQRRVDDRPQGREVGRHVTREQRREEQTAVVGQGLDRKSVHRIDEPSGGPWFHGLRHRRIH